MAIKTGKRNFKKIAALAAAAVMSAQFCTNVFAAEKQAEECTDPKVRITIDGQSSFYYTKDKTVGELLKEKNINIDDYKTEAKVEDIITDGMQIKLQSPVTVKVNVNSGKEVFDYTTKVETIGQLMVELKEKNNVTYKVTDGHSSSEKLENNAVVYLNAEREEIYVVHFIDYVGCP